MCSVRTKGSRPGTFYRCRALSVETISETSILACSIQISAILPSLNLGGRQRKMSTSRCTRRPPKEKTVVADFFIRCGLLHAVCGAPFLSHLGLSCVPSKEGYVFDLDDTLSFLTTSTIMHAVLLGFVFRGILLYDAASRWKGQSTTIWRLESDYSRWQDHAAGD